MNWCCKTLPLCFFLFKRNKTKRLRKKRKKSQPPGVEPKTFNVLGYRIILCAKQPLLRSRVKLIVFNIFWSMKSCRWTLLQVCKELKDILALIRFDIRRNQYRYSGELRNGLVQIWKGVVCCSRDFTFRIRIVNLISTPQKDSFFIITNVLSLSPIFDFLCQSKFTPLYK